LRAIALQLKQITSELRQMVANASGQGQAGVMEVSVNVTSGGSVGNDQTDHAVDKADSAVASTDDSATAASDSSTVVPAQAEMASTGSAGNQGLGGNMELQALLNSIKAIAQWLKQRSQQSQGHVEGLKKWLDGSQQDLAAIDHMLSGGNNTAQDGLSVSIQLATGGDAGESATSDAGSAGNVNVQA
jgi:hypothetical protein